jgi:hypothetical protein
MTKHDSASSPDVGGTKMNRTLKTTLGALLAAALLAGCAQEMGTIDRVQDNLVKKADLLFAPDGTRKEWYYRSTVIDAPHASAYSFVGMQTRMERGVFDIQEKMLLFYRTYTFTEGEHNKDYQGKDTPREDVDMTLKCRAGVTYCDADGKALVKDCDCDGDYLLGGKKVWVSKNAPLLAFPIDDHVDIIWEYNPSTGEQTNVRVENTTDRLWWEREFVRVEWGYLQFTNLQDPIMPAVLSSASCGNPGTYMLKDRSAAPDVEPRITPAQGYIEYVGDVTLGGKTSFDPDYGTIPLCWYYPWYSGGIYECVSERLRFRDAFVAVDTEASRKYTPKDYTDHDMNRFGFFRDERLTWDSSYGATYSGVIRHASLFDLWDKDDAGNVTGVKPIVYNLSEGYTRDYVEEANAAAVEYAKVYDGIVKSVTGKAPAEFGVEHMWVMCENNWKDVCAARAADPNAILAQVTPPCVMGGIANDDGTAIDQPSLDQACGCRPFVAGATCETEIVRKVNGDFRWSFLYDVQGPAFAAPGGFGPWASDPLTGRVISAAAYIYSGYLEMAANRLLDRLELLAGAKSFGQHTSGSYITQQTKYSRLKASSYWKAGYSKDDAKKLVDGLVKPEVAAALTAAPPQKTDANFTQARLAMLSRHPEIESMFVNDDIRMLFKELPRGENTAVTTQGLDRYALRNWAYARGHKDRLSYRKRAAEMALDLREFYDTAYSRLGDEIRKEYDAGVCAALQAQGGLAYDFGAFGEGNPCTVEKLVDQLRVKVAYANQQSPFSFMVYNIPTPLETDVADPVLRETQKATIAALRDVRPAWVKRLMKRYAFGLIIHELGHNQGLRHNFEATNDAFNFFPTYWDYKVTKKGDRYEPVSLWGRITDQQAAGTGGVDGFGMREVSYSSIMDYHFKSNSAWAGLGLWDKAALKYAYGDLVEVFETEPNLDAVVDTETGAKARDYAALDPSSIDPTNQDPFKLRAEDFGIALQRIHPLEYPNLWGDVSKMFARRDVKKSDVLGAACASEGSDCGGGKVCKRFYEGLRCSIPQTMVPYKFGGDEMSYGIQGVATFDEGIDAFERTFTEIEVLENNWVFNGYWHENIFYWPTVYAASIDGMYQQMRREFQYFVLGYSVYNHDDYWFKRFGKRWEQDMNGGLPGAMAARASFDYMAQSFGRPVPTSYGFNNLTKRYEPIDQVNFSNYSNPTMFLEEDGARPMYGYWNYDGYKSVVTSSGAIYDRLAAMEMLSDPEMYLLGADSSADTRKYMINYATIFRDEVRDLLGGLMANNATKYGWCVALGSFGAPIGFLPRPFASVGQPEGAANPCDKLFCGTTASGSLQTQVADFTDPANPKCPAGMDLLAGQPIEPEELYTFPTTRFRIPMLAAYYGLALLSGNFDVSWGDAGTFDRSFVNATRLWIKGSKFAVEPPAGAKVATCEDRLSGKIYETYALDDGMYYPAYDLVQQCNEMFNCYDPVINKTLTNDQKNRCKAWAPSETPLDEWTIENLHKDYLFHPLQFLVGKLELIRAMHATYAYADTSYLDPYGTPPEEPKGECY